MHPPIASEPPRRSLTGRDRGGRGLPRRGHPSRAQRIAALLLTLAAANVCAQSKPSEYDVKAAYLFNFGKFMRLSPAPATPRHLTFDICILGHDPIGHVLDAITANEAIDNRAVRVVRLDEASAVRNCEVVFISADEGDGIPADLAAIAHADVLTVSDAADFLKSGGMVQFVSVANHVRFAVNLDAVSRTHLVLSSDLLRVAASVTGKPSAEDRP